jgi:hypothetical protein
MLANRLQTVNPGDESLSAAFDASKQHELLFNPGYPSMNSTPLKINNFANARAQLGTDREQSAIVGNSVVIAPPADTLAAFDPLASKTAPLAKLEDCSNPSQSTVGHYWKTFDEDDVTSPGSGLDESSSESSDDENFSENFTGQKIIPVNERNGWVDLSENTPNGGVQPNTNAHAGGLGPSSYQQNGILNEDLKTLQINNNNHIGTDTRTAVQTDF